MQVTQNEQKSALRLYVGGLANSVTEELVKDKISNYGTVTAVNLKTKHAADGQWIKTFAFVSVSMTDNEFGKCVGALNKTKWKGSTLLLQKAQESQLERLQKERESNLSKSDTPAKSAKKAEVISTPAVGKKSAKPGEKVNGKKDWVTTKYGREVPIMNIRSKDKKKVERYDPSTYCHTLKKFPEKPGDEVMMKGPVNLEPILSKSDAKGGETVQSSSDSDSSTSSATVLSKKKKLKKAAVVKDSKKPPIKNVDKKKSVTPSASKPVKSAALPTPAAVSVPVHASNIFNQPEGGKANILSSHTTPNISTTSNVNYLHHIEASAQSGKITTVAKIASVAEDTAVANVTAVGDHKVKDVSGCVLYDSDSSGDGGFMTSRSAKGQSTGNHNASNMRSPANGAAMSTPSKSPNISLETIDAFLAAAKRRSIVQDSLSQSTLNVEQLAENNSVAEQSNAAVSPKKSDTKPTSNILDEKKSPKKVKVSKIDQASSIVSKERKSVSDVTSPGKSSSKSTVVQQKSEKKARQAKVSVGLSSELPSQNLKTDFLKSPAIPSVDDKLKKVSRKREVLSTGLGEDTAPNSKRKKEKVSSAEGNQAKTPTVKDGPEQVSSPKRKLEKTPVVKDGQEQVSSSKGKLEKTPKGQEQVSSKRKLEKTPTVKGGQEKVSSNRKLEKTPKVKDGQEKVSSPKGKLEKTPKEQEQVSCKRKLEKTPTVKGGQEKVSSPKGKLEKTPTVKDGQEKVSSPKGKLEKTPPSKKRTKVLSEEDGGSEAPLKKVRSEPHVHQDKRKLREEANVRRLQSLREQKEARSRQQNMIKASLDSTDTKSNTKITFESSDDNTDNDGTDNDNDDDVSAAACSTTLQSSNEGQRKNDVKLFDSGEDDSDDEVEFKIPTAEEAKIKDQQWKAKHNRFVFPDENEPEAGTQEMAPEGDERDRNLGILSDILGPRAVSSARRGQGFTASITTQYYDPEKESCQALTRGHEPKLPVSKMKQKPAKAAEPVPEVSKDKFFEVDTDLKKAFEPTSSDALFTFDASDEESSRNRSETSTVKKGKSDGKTDVNGQKEEVDVPTNFFSTHSDSSSDDDVDDASDEEDEGFSQSLGTQTITPAIKPTFFFSENDPRLKEGRQFYRTCTFDEWKTKWEERKPILMAEFQKQKRQARERKKAAAKRKGQLAK